MLIRQISKKNVGYLFLINCIRQFQRDAVLLKIHKKKVVKMGLENILSDLEFSKDEVLKKHIVSRDNYKVIRISLETGLEIAPHNDNHSVLFLVLQGKGIFTSKKGETELAKNEYISIEADEIRGIKSIENLVVLVVRD